MSLKRKEFPPVIYSQQIESHLTWIQCNIPYIEQTALGELGSMEEYVMTVIAAEKQTQMTEAVVAKGSGLGENPKLRAGAGEGCDDAEDEEVDEFDDTSSGSIIGHFARKLNIAAMHAYVSDFEVAEANTAEGEKLLNDLDGGHHGAGLYCLEALKYSIAIMKNSPKLNDAGFLAAVKNLQFNDPVTRACITFLKGCLAVALNVPDKEVLMMFQTAAELDPECYLWHHHTFRKIRRIRRFERTKELMGPSIKEDWHCKQAYSKRPQDDFITVVDYGLLLKESLWGQRGQVWEDQIVDVIHCVDLFKEALGLAKEKKNDWWIKKIKIYLAEFLVFGKCQWLNQQEGKELLDECTKDYPSSSMVFHKAGKFYRDGFKGSKMYQDMEKAQQYLERGLECIPWNFPCLMDYIRLLKMLGKYDEVIKTIEKGLTVMKRDYQVAKLHVLRGCVVWQFDPFENPHYKKDASDSWLLVLEKYPTLDGGLYASVKTMHSRDSVDNSRKYVSRDRIIEHLESRQPEFAGEKIKAEALQTFIGELKITKDDGLDWSSIRCPRDSPDDTSDLEGRTRSLSISSFSSSGSGTGSYKSAYSQPPRGWQLARQGPQVQVAFNHNFANGYQKQDGFYRPLPPSSKKRQQRTTYGSVADADGDWRRK